MTAEFIYLTSSAQCTGSINHPSAVKVLKEMGQPTFNNKSNSTTSASWVSEGKYNEDIHINAPFDSKCSIYILVILNGFFLQNLYVSDFKCFFFIKIYMLVILNVFFFKILISQWYADFMWKYFLKLDLEMQSKVSEYKQHDMSYTNWKQIFKTIPSTV